MRADGQKALLAIRSMGGESEAAWRALLDDLVKRGLMTPELVIADGAPGLEKALAALWPVAPVQRCTVYADQRGQTGLRGGDRCEGRVEPIVKKQPLGGDTRLLRHARLSSVALAFG